MTTPPHSGMKDGMVGRAVLFLIAILWGGRSLASEVPSSAFFGFVETRDGLRQEGWISLESGGLRVQAEGGTGTNLVGLREVRIVQRTRSLAAQAGAGDQGLRGSYFPKPDFGGTPVQRLDPIIQFSWGDDSPLPELPADRFTVRWEGKVRTRDAGLYRFHVDSDDGTRLWIDGRKIIDDWRDRSATESRGELTLEAASDYRLRLEYFENSGQAVARLSWTPPGAAEKDLVPSENLMPAPLASEARFAVAQGLVGMYFNNTNLTGPFVLQTNATLNFLWGEQPPFSQVTPDQFSVRWTGRITPDQGDDYQFHVEADDGVRLWVNGQLLIDRWLDGVFNISSEPLRLEQGTSYPLRLEFYENRHGARLQLFWSSPALTRRIVPAAALSPDAARPLDLPPAAFRQGVLLRNGTLIGRPPHHADAGELRFTGDPRDPAIATVNVSRIHFHPLPGAPAAPLQPDRPGVLLRSGDFAEGELRRIDGSGVTLDTVLLGVKRFSRNEALALVLRPIDDAAPARYEVVTRDGSQLRVGQLELHPNQILLEDSILAGWTVPVESLVQLRRLE